MGSFGSFVPLDEVDDAAEMAPGVMQLHPGAPDAPPALAPPPARLGTRDMLSDMTVGWHDRDMTVGTPAQEAGRREGGGVEGRLELAAAGVGAEAKAEAEALACDVPHRPFGGVLGWR